MKKSLKHVIILFIILFLINANIPIYASDSYSEFNNLSLYKTGDIPIAVFIVLFVISLFGVIILVIKKKKREKQPKRPKHTPKRLK